MDVSTKTPTPSTSTSTSTSTPPEPSERFLRGQRRGAVRARTRTKRLSRNLFRLVAVVGVTSGLAAIGVWGASAMSRSPELTVDRVRVEGNVRLSDGEILELLELTEGSNILTLDLDEVRDKLLRSAWVRDVALERVLPATLTLSIEERKPVAVAILRELYLLAEDGTILDQVSPHSDIKDLPLARGLIEDERAAPEKVVLAGRIASEIESDARLAALVSELDVSAGGRSVAIRLRAPSITLLVSEENMMARLREAVPLIEGIAERFPALEVMDLRFRGRVYLRMAADEPTAGAGSDGGASF